MRQRTAILTITLGDRSTYERLFLPSIRAYAARIGADFYQLTEPIQPLHLQESYTPLQCKQLICLQKLCIGTLSWVQEYDWILIIDADILMNYEKSPNIFDQVSDGFIYGVNERSQFGLNDWSKEVWKRFAPHLPGDSAGYYRRLGFDMEFPEQLNTGFLVFQPRLQGSFLQTIYDTYLPRIVQGEDLDGDQGPLNYEGWKAGRLACLDPRWNRVWLLTYVLLYPFLNETQHRAELQQALKCQFDLNYCIHMAGRFGWSLLQ